MAIKESEADKLLGFDNGLPNLIVDIGNKNARQITDQPEYEGHNGTDFISNEHAIVEVDEAYFRNVQYYYKNEPGYHLIEWNGRFFITGEPAYSVRPSIEPTTGRAKYRPDYYGILFIRNLNEQYHGNPPKAVNAFLAHPPADRDHVAALAKSVIREWKFKVNGKPVQTSVRYVDTFEEILGGVMNVSLGHDGEPMDDKLNGNGPTLVFDLGGGSLDLARLQKDGSIDFNKVMDSVRVGVNSALRMAKENADRKWKDLLGDAEDGFSMSMIIDMFQDEKHTMRAFNETLDCKLIYEQAAKNVIRQCVGAVRDFTRGLANYNLILLTGGGPALFYDLICEELFPKHHTKNAIIKADLARDMWKANVKGGRKMLIGIRQQQRKAYNRVLGHKKR
jgi:hypothetical protein